MVTEQHVYLALEVYNHTEKESPLWELAFDSIAMYAVQEISKTKDEFSEQEFADFINELIIRHTLAEMVKKDLIEPEIQGDEIVYSMTENGKKYLDKEKND